MRKLFFFIIISFLFSSCYQTEIEEATPLLVVEGWVENGNYPIVQLTTTVPISREHHSVDSLNQFLIKWAKVTIDNGDKKVVLIGKYDKSYNPPFIYTTTDMKGEIGKTYTLQVDYEQFHANAKATILSPVEIDNLQFVEGESNPAKYSIKVSFHDNPQQKDYYKFFVLTKKNSSTFISPYFGTFNDEVIGEFANVMVYNGRSNLVHPMENPFFNAGNGVILKFCHIDSVGYQYWKAFEDYYVEGRNPIFNSSKNLPTNISGGIGYWLGYGVTYRNIQIPSNIGH